MADIITDEMVKAALSAVWTCQGSTPQDNMRSALEAALAVAERDREKGKTMNDYDHCTSIWCFDNPSVAADFILSLAYRAEKAEAEAKDVRARDARLIRDMISAEPWKSRPAVHGALEMAARTIERGRHLTAEERFANFRQALKDAAADLESEPDHG